MALLKLIACLPNAWLEPLAKFLYLVSWPFTGKDRSRIMENAMRVLKLDEGGARVFARDVLLSQALIYFETMKYLFYPDKLVIEGLEPLKAILNKSEETPEGRVIITAHLGAWELAGHFCAVHLKRPFYVLAKPSKTTWIDPILNDLRERLCMKVLWTDSKSLYRDMIKALDRSESVGFVMDQKPAQKQGGHAVTFLGVPNTPIVTGAATLITKKNAAALGAYCLRIGLCRYRVVVTEIIPPNHGITDLEAATGILAKNMEHMILSYRDQWAWNYKRWRW